MPQALIDVHSCLKDFNPTKFTVYSSTLLFSILFCLKLDNRIRISYWFVFLPLWLWKSLTFLGALVGVIIWIRNPDYRVTNSSQIHFKSMLISTLLQALLLMFEILICDKLETKRHTWTVAFLPLIFVSLLSISVCAWSIRNRRGIELEFFAAINILQFVLIALKLDNNFNRTWLVIFTPSWILLCFAIFIIIYMMIFTLIVFKASDVASVENRRSNIYSASTSSMIFLPLLVFIIFLTSKLDSPPNVVTPSYFATCTPLFITLLFLIRFSFESKTGGSLWWFGMRTDFCTYLLRICPCLKEYGNTSYAIASPRQSQQQQQQQQVEESIQNSNRHTIQQQQRQQLTTSSNQSNMLIGGSGSSTDNMENHQQQAHDLSATSANHRTGGNAKRLLFSLSRVFSIDKGQPFDEDEIRSDQTNGPPVMPKLSIDSPD